VHFTHHRQQQSVNEWEGFLVWASELQALRCSVGCCCWLLAVGCWLLLLLLLLLLVAALIDRCCCCAAAVAGYGLLLRSLCLFLGE
jgi:hypothetical protein